MSAWVTLILVLSLIAYASNRFSLQTVSLSVISGLAVIYALAPGDAAPSVAPAFSGFASEALVAIVALMVLGKALIITGALQPVSTLLSGALASFPRLAFAAVLTGGFAISGFLNDTPVVVMLMPILLGAAQNAGRPAGTMLMPMNHAVILGGMMTAIGTSTNLLVNGLSAGNGGPAFGFFDFYLIALPPAILGLLYLMLVAPWILRHAGEVDAGGDDELFLSAFRISNDSILVGKPLHHLRKTLDRGIVIRQVERHGKAMVRFPTLQLLAGDQLVLAGTAERLHKAGEQLHLSHGDGKAVVEERGGGESLVSRRCIVSAGSPIVGRTVRQSAIEWRFDVRVTGLSEATSRVRASSAADLPTLPIHAGDTLLLEGSEDRIGRACEMLSLVPVGEPLRRRASGDAMFALGIFLLTVAAAVFKIVPISVAATIGVLLTVATNLLRWEDSENAVEWRIVLIVASSIALGDALVRSGTMAILADHLAAVAGDWPLPVLLAAIITVTGLLTNFVSNNAAAAIMTPLGLELARGLNVPLEPFVLGVLFGANLCFLTPFAYQTNLLVMAAAGYRFNDFLKTGLPLFLLMVPALTASLSWHFF
ncbi:MAG: SLC13 family permease [Burkholderiaceae bacterium]